MAVLPNLTQQLADQQALIAALQAKLALASQPKRLTFKITAKKADGTGTDGALSLYGLGRFPITLYRSQWLRLLGAKDEIMDFIEDHAALLATKD